MDAGSSSTLRRGSTKVPSQTDSALKNPHSPPKNPNDIIKTDEFILSANRHPAGFFKHGSGPLNMAPRATDSTTNSNNSNREVSWRTTVTEKQYDKEEKTLRKIEKEIRERQQGIQAELLGFFGEEADLIREGDDSESSSSSYDESDDDIEDLSLPTKAASVVAEQQANAPSPRTAHKMYMMNQPLPGQKSIPKRKKKKQFSMTAARDLLASKINLNPNVGQGKAKLKSGEMWYSINGGGSKVPAPEAMTQHELAMQKAGVNRPPPGRMAMTSSRKDDETSLRGINEVSRRFRDVSEVFPNFSILHQHLNSQVIKYGFDPKPFVENVALRSDSVASPWTLHNVTSVRDLRSNSQTEHPSRAAIRKRTLLSDSSSSAQPERSSEASYHSISSPDLMKGKRKKPVKAVAGGGAPGGGAKKGPRTVPKKPPPPPSDAPPPKPLRPKKPSPHAVAITLSFMYNKSIKLRPYEPMPSPSAKTNKHKSRLSMAAANLDPQSLKTIPRVSPVAKAPPRPPAPPTPPAPPLLTKQIPVSPPPPPLPAKVPEVPKPIVPSKPKAKPILGRLPSSIPPPPPDEDEVDDVKKDEAVGKSNVSVVSSGLAPVAPPPPLGAFSSNIVETEEFALSGGSKGDLGMDNVDEHEVGAGEGSSVDRASATSAQTVVSLGLAPIAPAPPSQNTVEDDAGEDNDGNDDDDDDDGYGSYDDSDGITTFVEPTELSDEMKKALTTQIRRGSVDCRERVTKERGLTSKEVMELLHQKDHSRFSILRMSTVSVDSEDEDGNEEVDWDEEEESWRREEEEEEEQQQLQQIENGGDVEEGDGDNDDDDDSRRGSNNTTGTSDTTFFEKFMYKVDPVEARGGRADSVLTKPRTLTVIKQEEEQLQLEREKAEAAKRSRAAAQAKAKASMEGFLSGGIPGPPESVEISSPQNFVHEARGSLSRPPAASRLASKPRVRERDLSDAEFYYVYSMTRHEFKRLGILKRAWLRSENMHRRPYLGDSS